MYDVKVDYDFHKKNSDNQLQIFILKLKRYKIYKIYWMYIFKGT